ncbi:hypothetical protein C8245_16330 [Paracidovorax avenae]|uniref:NACHT domain-containing protein n=1 Tax=Paracidovorax avenae TaxID=80867 RepID=UPI000D21165E|nr:NACHT domain-containing protein [Paracidovorax avenae]AVS67041.1 hypothetical protein C8245_16330 [Paracidovorax avenae]
MSDALAKSQLWDFAKHVFDVIWAWQQGGDLGRWILVFGLIAVTLIVALTLMFKALTKVLDAVLKAGELYKGSGLPVPMLAEDYQRVRQRAQFCGVLGADLAQLAKSESWNDQWFTDLEAEVESEGGYYPSPLYRLLRRPMQGLRKEKSLIRALMKSTERAVQLVGEPGAGKSVALRHLAVEMAKKGQRSKARKVLVPLYINLREMAATDLYGVTADAIKEFVLDNIRRGDSDTTAFVRDNWARYRDDGTWFFLFDSFDEIPAVLHAEKGSAAATAYSQAIRHFLEGMGTCKGVLASREFKGPEALAWKKFRILPLDLERQRALVNNANLPLASAPIVLRHLADSAQIGATPLFLTLLCRHVKIEGKAPTNDHDLLSIHLERLASKDADYLARHHGLRPAQLLAGAEQIARLFAQEPQLGLAPTYDQIAARVDVAALPGGDLQKLLAALVACKIGRTDVPNAMQGDLRFAFAHRRYQESLFVRFLVRHPAHLSATALLSDPRWREYAVTLLQTEPADSLAPLMSEAVSQLDAAPDAWISARAPAPVPCGFHAWRGQSGVYLLELLQEGMARRMQDVPNELRDSVARYLVPRWELGDAFDRSEVVRLGSLLPEAQLASFLTVTFAEGTPNAQSAAFRQAPSLRGEAPSALIRAVLRRLSGEVLASSGLAKLIELEALAARLPSAWGAMHVYGRNVFLRKVLGIVRWGTCWFVPYRLIEHGPEKVARKIFPFQAKRQFTEPTTPMGVLTLLVVSVFTLPLSLLLAAYRAKGWTLGDGNLSDVTELLWREAWASSGAGTASALTLAFVFILGYLTVLLCYSLRYEGHRLTPAFVTTRFASGEMWKTWSVALLAFLLLVVTLVGLALAMGVAGRWIYQLTTGEDAQLPVLVLGTLILLSAIYIGCAILVTWLTLRTRRHRRIFAALRTDIHDGLAAIARFDSSQALASVLNHWPNLASDTPTNRSLGSWLSLSLRRADVPAPLSAQMKDGRPAESVVRACLELLELRMSGH